MGRTWEPLDHSLQGDHRAARVGGGSPGRSCAGWSRRGTGQMLAPSTSSRSLPTACTRRAPEFELTTPVVVVTSGLITAEAQLAHGPRSLCRRRLSPNLAWACTPFERFRSASSSAARARRRSSSLRRPWGAPEPRGRAYARSTCVTRPHRRDGASRRGSSSAVSWRSTTPAGRAGVPRGAGWTWSNDPGHTQRIGATVGVEQDSGCAIGDGVATPSSQRSSYHLERKATAWPKRRSRCAARSVRARSTRTSS